VIKSPGNLPLRVLVTTHHAPGRRQHFSNFRQKCESVPFHRLGFYSVPRKGVRACGPGMGVTGRTEQSAEAGKGGRVFDDRHSVTEQDDPRCKLETADPAAQRARPPNDSTLESSFAPRPRVASFTFVPAERGDSGDAGPRFRVCRGHLDHPNPCRGSAYGARDLRRFSRARTVASRASSPCRGPLARAVEPRRARPVAV
jgi:hypothetical protein